METWDFVTPDGVTIQYERADLGSRATALLLDILIEGVAAVALVLTSLLLPVGIRPTGVGVALVLDGLLVFGYFIVLESLGGQTVGKRLVGIRVMRETSARCGWTAGILRNVLRLIDFLPLFFAVGIVSIFVSSKRQRLGDLVAGTVVVRAPSSAVRGRTAARRPDGSWPVERGDVERVLAPLGPTLLQAETWAERRPELLPDAARALARRLADRAALILGTPPPANPELFLTHLLFLREELLLPRSARAVIDGGPLDRPFVEGVIEAAHPVTVLAARRAAARRQSLLTAWRAAHPAEATDLDDYALWVALQHRAWRLQSPNPNPTAGPRTPGDG